MPSAVEIIVKNDSRGVAFLVSDDINHVNTSAFDDLSENDRFTFMSRFNAWLDGIIHKSYFHGFDKDQYGGKYTECFQFTKKPYRLYGFLCHPKGDRYQLCVLAILVRKNEWEIDETQLKRVEAMRVMDDVIKASRIAKMRGSK